MLLRVPLRLSIGLALACAALPALADDASAPLATYRAVDDFIVDGSTAGPGVTNLSGRLVTEFTGSACAGYTTISRFVTEGTDSDGNDELNDQRSKTVESIDGRMDFSDQTYAANKLTEQSSGTAVRGPDAITVNLDQPEEKTFSLDRAIAFPTEQLTRVLAAARAGQTFVTFGTFDGSDTGDQALPTSTVIGPPSTATDDLGDETAIAKAGFAGMRHWMIVVSYFDAAASDDDETPAFTMSSILYDNGVQRSVKIDYGTFALVGKLTSLDMLPPTPCTPK